MRCVLNPAVPLAQLLFDNSDTGDNEYETSAATKQMIFLGTCEASRFDSNSNRTILIRFDSKVAG